LGSEGLLVYGIQLGNPLSIYHEHIEVSQINNESFLDLEHTFFDYTICGSFIQLRIVKLLEYGCAKIDAGSVATIADGNRVAEAVDVGQLWTAGKIKSADQQGHHVLHVAPEIGGQIGPDEVHRPANCQVIAVGHLVKVQVPKNEIRELQAISTIAHGRHHGIVCQAMDL